MICFESPENVSLFGRYGVEDGRILLIDIDRCYEEDKNCKSDEEIEEFFQTHNLGMLYSSIEYQPDVYTNETLKKGARLDWLGFNSFNVTYPVEDYNVKTNTLSSMQDFSGIITKEDTFYTIERGDSKWYALDF